MNCTRYAHTQWPNQSSEYIHAYSWEVYDFSSLCQDLVEKSHWAHYISAAYVLFIFLGQEWMKNQKPFNLRRPLFFWNLALALMSLVAFLRITPEVLFLLQKPNGIFECFCRRFDTHNYATGFWLYVLLVSKLVELGDTGFIVLRKQKLIFLHWYHHLTVILGCAWLGMTFDPLFRLAASINSFVHAVMYTYFALRAHGVKVPRKVAMCITILQLTQFVIVVGLHFYTINLSSNGEPCARRAINTFWWGFFGVTYLYLFGKFFYDTYMARPSKKIM